MSSTQPNTTVSTSGQEDWEWKAVTQRWVESSGKPPFRVVPDDSKPALRDPVSITTKSVLLAVRMTLFSTNFFLVSCSLTTTVTWSLFWKTLASAKSNQQINFPSKYVLVILRYRQAQCLQAVANRQVELLELKF